MQKPMNIKEIEDLLKKYYEGETSLSDERSLKAFFMQPDVPDHLKPHQSVFRFFNEEAGVQLEEEKLEQSLLRKIELYKADTAVSHAHPGKKRLYYLTGIAAGIFMVISLVFVIRNEIRHRQAVALQNNRSEIAYTQARQALLMVSVGLNTGIDAARRLNTLDKAVEQIQLVNKFFNYSNQFMNPDEMMNPSIKQ
jgi:hypothetical protein